MHGMFATGGLYLFTSTHACGVIHISPLLASCGVYVCGVLLHGHLLLSRSAPLLLPVMMLVLFCIFACLPFVLIYNMQIKEEVREDLNMQAGLQVPYCCRSQPATYVNTT
jgi:hypothetical protein